MKSEKVKQKRDDLNVCYNCDNWISFQRLYEDHNSPWYFGMCTLHRRSAWYTDTCQFFKSDFKALIPPLK